jgi:hypothetical protein
VSLSVFIERSRYDVGMASMLAMELQSLANLSLTAFNPPRTAQHASIMKQLTGLQTLISKNLWNEEIGIFSNKFSAEYTGKCNASGITTGNCSGVECCKHGYTCSVIICADNSVRSYD